MIILAIMAILLGISMIGAAKEPLLACVQPYHWETLADRIVSGTLATIFVLAGLLLILVGVVSAFVGR